MACFFLEPFLGLFSNFFPKSGLGEPLQNPLGSNMASKITHVRKNALKSNTLQSHKSTSKSQKSIQITEWMALRAVDVCLLSSSMFFYFSKENDRNNTLNATLQIPRETSSRWDIHTLCAHLKTSRIQFSPKILHLAPRFSVFFSAQDRLQDVVSNFRRFVLQFIHFKHRFWRIMTNLVTFCIGLRHNTAQHTHTHTHINI